MYMEKLSSTNGITLRIADAPAVVGQFALSEAGSGSMYHLERIGPSLENKYRTIQLVNIKDDIRHAYDPEIGTATTCDSSVSSIIVGALQSGKCRVDFTSNTDWATQDAQLTVGDGTRTSLHAFEVASTAMTNIELRADDSELNAILDISGDRLTCSPGEHSSMHVHQGDSGQPRRDLARHTRSE